MAVRRPFCELLHQQPKPTLDHVAFLERRYEREVQRQELLDRSQEEFEAKRRARRHQAAEAQQRRREQERRQKAAREAAVGERAVAEREATQRGHEELAERVLGSVSEAAVRRECALNDTATRAKAKAELQHRAAWARKLDGFSASCGEVGVLAERSGAFAARPPHPCIYPPLGSTFASSNGALTPRPPPDASPLSRSAPSPFANGFNTSTASGNGRGVLTKKAVKAAKAWVKYKMNSGDAGTS